MTVRVELNELVIAESLRAIDGQIAKGLFRVATRVEGVAKRRAPVNTGRLRSSIKKRIVNRGGRLVAQVTCDVNYAAFVHEGTGTYGPRRRRITPTGGSFLVFTPRGASRPVFARSVAGTKPNPFLRDALIAVIK